MTEAGTSAAADLLHRAIRTDARYALAKATLGFIHAYRDTHGWCVPSDAAAAGALAREALADDRNDPNTLSLAGLVISGFAGDYDRARAALDRAVLLNPNGAQVLNRAGWVCCHRGEAEKAIDYFTRAMRLSPLDPEIGFMLTGLGRAHLMAGRNEEGLAFTLRAIEEMPGWVSCYRYAILALVRLGRIDKARSVAARCLQSDPSYRIARTANRIGRTGKPHPDHAFVVEANEAQRVAGIPD